MNDASSKPDDADSVQALVRRMDELLAEGAALREKADQFYQQHGLEQGIGQKILLSDAVSERDREIFRRLIAEYEMMEQRIQSLATKTQSQSSKIDGSTAPRPVGALAVGSRYRI